MRLVRHIALVDFATNRDGDVVESLCGKRQPGQRDPGRHLFSCDKCVTALSDAYEEANGALKESYKSLALISLLADSETSLRSVKRDA